MHNLWHQGALCAVVMAALWCLGSNFASGSTLAALGCSWARFVVSGCNLVVFGAQFCSILSNQMQLPISRVHLCSIWEAASHPIYNTGLHHCIIYSTGVQRSIINVSLKSIFVMPGADFSLSGTWPCSISGVWDAVVDSCHQGVQLPNISSPKARICQSWGWNLVGLRTFFLVGFVTFGTVFFGGAEPVAAAGEEDDAVLHQAGRRRLLPHAEGGV